MRFSRLSKIAMALAVIGSCSVWSADVLHAQNATKARVALAQPIKELNVDGVTLFKVVEFLRDSSGANIIVNWKTLEAAGIAKETPISLQVRDLSLRKMIHLVLNQASPATELVFTTDSNVIQITTQEEADKVIITKVYVVDDLVMTDNGKITPPSMNLTDITKGGTTSGSGGSSSSTGSSGIFTENTNTSTQSDETSQKRGEDLASLVRDVVRPTIWKENGGPASIKYFNGKLIVSAPASVHEAIGGPIMPEGGQRFGM
jgi:hypothetical protein